MAQQVEVDNPYGLALYSVQTPTGSTLNLQTEGEAVWYERQRDTYLEHNRFTNVSDLEDLTRLLTLEIMVSRWQTWLTQGFDYVQTRINENDLRTSIKDYSMEIRQVKASLGIDRVTRERDKGESVGDYVAVLLKRAKEFGVGRDKQYSRAVTNMWELISMVKTHDRCDDQERRELDLTEKSIVQWVRERVIPEWEEMNASFRENQRIWITDL